MLFLPSQGWLFGTLHKTRVWPCAHGSKFGMVQNDV
jgi:hypothetical protein